LPHLLFLVTEDWYLCSHRLPLARAAIADGFRISVVTRVARHGDEIRAAGIELVPMDLRRRSMNPFQAGRTVFELARIYRRVRPDIVHHVALKPVLYGSMAARLAGVPAVVNAVAGMGYAFSSTDFKARLLRPAISAAFRALLNAQNSRLIVQNPDDRALLIARGIVDAERVRLIRGSGVDTTVFLPHPEPTGTPVVMLASRILRDKGVLEFIDAAKQLVSESVAARFVLVGAPDPENPASISPAQLKDLIGDAVEWWGPRDDMPRVLTAASVVCLPSYREGLPKILLEAAACGRPIVATDVPGCREVVMNGESGLLVPARDAGALATAIKTLLGDSSMRSAMGARGRQLAEDEFSVERIAEETIRVYHEVSTTTFQCGQGGGG
jgi:glycosyltransferase involved in cell wall biosynthesis